MQDQEDFEEWTYQLKSCDVIFAFLNTSICNIEAEIDSVVRKAKILEDYNSEANIDY